MSNQIIQIKDGSDNILPVNNESGSNANGNYTKFPDGLMIQWGGSSAYGDNSRLVTVTLPIAFSSASYTVALTNAPLNDTVNYRGTINTLTATTSVSFTVRQENFGSYHEVHRFNWLAIGRWK